MSIPNLLSRRSTSWVNALIPREWRAVDPELERKSRVMIAIVFVGLALCAVGSVRHMSNGAFLNASLTALASLPLALSMLVLRGTRSIEFAAHWLCGYSTLITLLAAWLSGIALEAFAGLLVVPVAATAIGGARVGLLWTAIEAGLLFVIATRFSQFPSDEIVGLNSVLSVVIVGAALAFTEGARARAAHGFRSAVDEARLHSDRSEHVEQRLAESENLFATTFDLAPSVLLLSVFETGEVLAVNESLTRMIGYTADEVVGRDLVELGVWRSDAMRGRLIEGFESARVGGLEVPMFRKDGTEVWLMVSAARLKIDGRDCLLASGIDISERRKERKALEKNHAELESSVAQHGAELAESRLRLQEAERLATVGTLAAGLAHQINNPIGGIAAACEFALMVEGDSDAGDVQKEALQTALAEAHRCGWIVKSILKFSRNEPTPRWVEDLNITVKRAVQLCGSYVERTSGKLEVALWPGPLPSLISPIDLEQVVVNLVRNAAESMKGGAEVLVVTERVDDTIELSVQDNGRGISEAERSRIYDPFYTTRLEDGGFGLGLSVVHGIVVDHGGVLEVESPPEGGARFVVRLPLAEDIERAPK